MPDPVDEKDGLKVECPCCGSSLVVDAARGVVVECREPVNPRKTAELKDARQLLEDESSRIHEKYRPIVDADKGRGAAMEQKFKDFLEQSKDEPAAKPVRDIDLE